MIPLLVLAAVVAGFAFYEVRKSKAAPAPAPTLHQIPPPGVIPSPVPVPVPVPGPTPSGAAWVSIDPRTTSLGPGSYRQSSDMPLEMWAAMGPGISAGLQASVSAGYFASAQCWGPADAPPADWPPDDVGPNRLRCEVVVPQGKTAPSGTAGLQNPKLYHKVAMGLSLV